MAINQVDWKRIDVSITWTNPITIKEVKELGEENCRDTYFYKILGLHNGNYKLFYIGKCVDQYFTTRIFQKDHRLKQGLFKENHKRHILMVSRGNVNEDQKCKREELNDIESLLIYSHTHDGFPLLKNKQCRLSHKVIKNYRITNKGWRKDKMYKTIAYGLFLTD